MKLKFGDVFAIMDEYEDVSYYIYLGLDEFKNRVLFDIESQRRVCVHDSYLNYISKMCNKTIKKTNIKSKLYITYFYKSNFKSCADGMTQVQNLDILSNKESRKIIRDGICKVFEAKGYAEARRIHNDIVKEKTQEDETIPLF